MKAAYVDSSALVKLAHEEPESNDLRSALKTYDRFTTSVVGRIELERALRRRRDPVDASMAAHRLLPKLDLIPLDAPIARAAGEMEPSGLRALDAIHLATVRALDDPQVALVSYDRRLNEAARSQGIRVEAPGADVS